MDLSEVEKKVLLLCMDDYVGFWNIIRMQDHQIGTDEPVPDWIINNSLMAIRNLIQMKLIVAGHLGKRTFIDSNLSCEDVIKSIKNEIKKFEKAPINYAFIFWFRATEKGEELAENILSAK